MRSEPAQSVHAYTARRVTLPRAKGRGGGKKSSGGIDRPNTLQSKTIVGIIDLLCEGPIGGLVDGAKSIFFNNTPLMNSSGGLNYKGVTYTFMNGAPDQGAVPGFPAVDNAVALDEGITHEIPISYEITNTLCTRASVTIELASLFTVDTKNGNTNPFSVEISIAVQEADGTQITVVDDTIKGKTQSAYQRSYTFPLPGEGPWTIKVFRVSPDEANPNNQNSVYLAAIDEIIDNQMAYPNSAYVALTFDSEYFGSTIPSRAYEIQGLLIQIPANYDPVARTYASTGPGTSGGTWDGVTMVAAVTDNPAWILYDLCSNNRYGMGLSASALEATKWDLYVIGQYCDGLVPDGYGGMEPRYTCNFCLSNQDDAYRVLQAVTSIFRGMSYWGAGTVRFTADMPAAVSQIVNQADVLNGNFTYEGTALNTRYTAAMVSFTDPSNYWQPTPIYYQDPNLLVESVIGPNIQQVNAIGATTPGQAYRQGKWLIISADLQTDTLTYQAAMDHLTIRPGEIIGAVDPAYQGVSLGGRLLAVSGTSTLSLQLDRGIVPKSGATYSFSVMLTDGTLADEVAIESWTQNEDGTTTVTIAETEALPEAGAVWNITASFAAPRQFRVIGATQPQRGVVEITALYHDPDKYDLVEQNIDITAPAFSVLPPLITGPIGPPSSLSVANYWVGEGTTTVLRSTVSWTLPEDTRVTSYDYSITSVNGYSGQKTGEPGPSSDIDNLPAGDTYTFGVRARTLDNRTSDWVYSAPTLIDGGQADPDAPTSLTAVGGFASVQLAWDAVDVFNLDHYEIWRAPVTSGVAGTYTLLNTCAATGYADTDSSVLTPNTTWSYEVRAVTTTGLMSPFSTAAQATTTTIATGDIQPNAVTSFAAIETNPGLTGTGTGTLSDVLDLAISVPAGGNRNAVLLINGQQSLSSGAGAYRYQVIVNGTTIFDRTVGQYLDYPTFQFDITLTAGATNTVTINWGADSTVLLSTVDAIVFGRAA